MNTSERIAIIDGCRTPFMRSGTAFYDLMAWELGRFAVKGLVAKTGVSHRDIDFVIMGSVATDIATTNVAREIMLGAGLPPSIPAYTCTLACVSANMAVTNGCDLIKTGQAERVIAGGVESFSDPDIKISRRYRRFILDLTMYRRPKTLRGKLRLLKGMKLTDFIVPERPAIAEYSTGLIMGENADRLAAQWGISREEQDWYAERSNRLSLDAIRSGRFLRELVPVIVPGRSEAVLTDNGPREDATAERLAKLRPVFDRRYGTVTAGNSSFLTDGGSAILLMREDKAVALGMKPLGFIKSYAYAGADLRDDLLLGPAFSIPRALKLAGLSLSDIGVFEVHEAFAAQILGNVRALESKAFARNYLDLPGPLGRVDFDRINTLGGSLSIGHPFGATGTRLITTCCNLLMDRNEQFGIVAGCAAGAVGSAIVIENAG